MHEFSLPMFARTEFITTMPQSEFPKTGVSKLLNYSKKVNVVKSLPPCFVALDKKKPELDMPVDIFVACKGLAKPLHNNPWILIKQKNQLFSGLDITLQNVDRPTSTIIMKTPKPGKYFWRPAEPVEEDRYHLKKNEEFYHLPVTTPA